MLSSSPLTEAAANQKCVLICQNRTCLSQGAAKVFTAFQTHPTPDYTAQKTGCLGQCGNGPMVLVLPDNVWYCRVQPEEVPAVVERHLQGGQPIRAMLSPHFHTRLPEDPKT
ncbi:MAG: ferredoxin [Stenomitos frigidus ULC029]